MKFIYNEKDTHEHDWVYNYLDKDKTGLKASPYLWTRIQAHIEELEREKRFNPDGYFTRIKYLSWVLPAMLSLSILFGVFVGRELSASMWNQNYFSSANVHEQITNDKSDMNPFQGSIEEETELPGIIKAKGEPDGK